MAPPNFEIREVSNTPSIQPAATSTTAFLGAAMRGPLNKPTRIKNLAGFERGFGDLQHDFELGYAIAQFFRNGGSDAWVVRIPGLASLAKIKKGLAALDAVDAINLLVLPGLTRREWIDSALAYSVDRHAFLIVDPPKNATTPSALLAQMERRAFHKGANGAIFFPWVKIADIASRKQMRLSAPSGTIAGLFARNDRNAGIWKTPSGKNATLPSVVELGCALTQIEIEELHARGINSLRKLPDNEFVLWSALTLAGDGEPQSEWKYIPLRRLALFIERSIARGTQWVVFESNNQALWSQICRSTEEFLYNLFQQGALSGRTPKDAYFVKCDRSTMTQNDIDNGRLNIVIGVALVKPAEFVILRIGQWTCEHCQN